ncbi:hypothetical protein AO715_01085 [Xanthomonas sp. Mitacek01]|nr:hypothetical protein AO715_01085 [Xanthomonas sp. Mitacek01]
MRLGLLASLERSLPDPDKCSLFAITLDAPVILGRQPPHERIDLSLRRLRIARGGLLRSTLRTTLSRLLAFVSIGVELQRLRIAAGTRRCDLGHHDILGCDAPCGDAKRERAQSNKRCLHVEHSFDAPEKL